MRNPPVLFPCKSARLAVATSVGLAFASTTIAQTTISWADIGTDWATGANWTGGVAPANDLTTNLASFGTTTPTNQPQIASNLSVNGVVFANGAGAFTLSSGNSSILTLGASGIDNQDDSTQTVSTALKLGTAASFMGSSTGALTITGNVDNNGFALSLSGNGAAANTVTGVISGIGGLIKSGTGTWTLSGANSYTGGTTINRGTLTLGANNTLPSTGNVIVNGTTAGSTTTFDVNGRTQTIGALTFGGAGATSTSENDVNIGTGGTLTLGGTVTFDATNNPPRPSITGGTLELGGTRIFDIGLSTVSGSDFFINSTINGVGAGLIKIGDGYLLLQAASNYTGGTTINHGTLGIITNNNVLPTTGNITVNETTAASTATLALNSLAQTIGTLTFGGPGATSTSTNVVNIGTGGTLTLGGTVTFDATNNPPRPSITGGTLELGGTRIFDIGLSTVSGSDFIITSTVNGVGSGLIKIGAGNMLLQGASNYTGGTIINHGTLGIITNNNVLPITGNVTINETTAASTATLALNSLAQTIGTLTFGGPGATSTSTNVVNIGTGGTLTLGGTVTFDATNNPPRPSITGGTLELGGTRIFDIGLSTVSGSDFLINSTINGVGAGLIKIGDGYLLLQAASNYTGGTTINHGTLGIITNNNVLPITGNVTINETTAASTATLALNSLAQTIGTLTFGGPGATSTSSNRIEIGTGGTLTLGGTVTVDTTNNPPAAVINGGTLELGSTRTFDIGLSTVSGSELFISSVVNGNGFGLVKTGPGSLVLQGTNTYTGITTVSDGRLVIGNGLVGSVAGDIVNNATVQFFRSNGITHGGGISGSGAVSQLGAGTLTLTAANSYIGGTTVSTGTLLVNNLTGSGVGTGAVSVLSGATLGGSGFIGGAATLQSGAHLAPGASPGTLTFTSSLTLDSGSILDFQLGTLSDLIRVSGGTLAGPSSGTVTINLSDAGGFASGTYTLFNFTSAATSSFDVADFTFGTLIGGTQLSEYSLGFSGSSLNLTYTAVPEPSTYAAIFAVAVLGVAVRSRQRRLAFALVKLS